MQNRYAGDAGDFGKLGLLRQIASSGLDIGVNWVLVPDENRNGDGKHTAYLHDPRFDGCDDTLRTALGHVIRNSRSVAALEAQRLIPRAVYDHEVLCADPMARRQWHANALRVFRSVDLVFLDPDNGVLVKSVPIGSKKSNKYVLPEEIIDYYNAGKSVIFYNHRCREKESAYVKRFTWIREHPLLQRAYLDALTFTRGTTRDYLMIIQPDHADRVRGSLDAMLRSPWKKHFHRLPLGCAKGEIAQ